MIDVVAAVIERDDLLLVARRPEGLHLAGLWEFPGGKVKRGETQPEALEREIMEELGVVVDVGDAVFDTVHEYADRTVRIFFYQCQIFGTPRPLLGQDLQWVARPALSSLSFPPADEELIRRLVASPG